MQRHLLTICVVLSVVYTVHSRWLPTRSQDDRLQRLRELLKDLLESEIEKSNYEHRGVYKREAENPGPEPTDDKETHGPPAVHPTPEDKTAIYSGKVIQVMTQKLKHR